MTVRTNRVLALVPVVARLAALLASAALMPMASGCGAWSSRHAVTVSGDASVSRPLAVDIDNQNGTVEISVDPELDRPTVKASCPGRTSTERQPDFVSAELVTEEGRGVLRVIASSPDRPEPKFVNLRIVVPGCDGLRVRNTGGRVRASGVSGAVDVVNDAPGLSGGTTIRFARPATQPVSVRANGGGIEVHVPEGSTGVLRLKTDRGTILSNVAKASVRNVTSTLREQTATINGGTNPITLTGEIGTIDFNYGVR